VRRLSLVMVATIPILFSVAVGYAVESLKLEGSQWRWVFWPACVLLAVAMVAAEVRGRSSGGTVAVDPAAAADQLAIAVRGQLQREEGLRRVHDPVALPVRWHPAPDHLVDHWENIQRAGAGASTRPAAVGGDLSAIGQVYRRIRSGRMIILGSAGAGKSTLSARLALALLSSRQSGDRVPVILSLASWEPGVTLADWVATQLLRDHPGLAVRDTNGRRLAGVLVERGAILPMLDGFDEVPEGNRRNALRVLNADPDQPLVVASRTDEYAAAVAETDVLTAAAGIELDPLTVDEVTDYLVRTTRRTLGEGQQAVSIWRPVLDRLRGPDPSMRHLRHALSTPLMIFLARTVYSDTPDHNPSDLLDVSHFPTGESFEEHLIAAFLPAVYQDHGSTHRRWTGEQAQRWLGFLARHLDRRGSRDIAWWQLRDSITPLTRLLLFMLVGAAAIGLMFGSRLGIANGLVVGTGGGTLLGLLLALPPGRPPTRSHLRIRGRGWEITRTAARWIMSAALFGLAWGLVSWLAGRMPQGPGLSVALGIAATVPLGLAGAFAFGFETPVDISTEASPSASLADDRLNAIRHAITLAAGIAGGLAAGRMLTLDLTTDLGSSLGLAAGLGLALGASFGIAPTAWGHWLFPVRLWLPLRGRLPWSVHAFLIDAHRRGVLRQVGAVYQFRHHRLQQHLARPTRGGTH
jgi:hypothetical protein